MPIDLESSQRLLRPTVNRCYEVNPETNSITTMRFLYFDNLHYIKMNKLKLTSPYS